MTTKVSVLCVGGCQRKHVGWHLCSTSHLCFRTNPSLMLLASTSYSFIFISFPKLTKSNDPFSGSRPNFIWTIWRVWPRYLKIVIGIFLFTFWVLTWDWSGAKDKALSLDDTMDLQRGEATLVLMVVASGEQPWHGSVFTNNSIRVSAFCRLFKHLPLMDKWTNEPQNFPTFPGVPIAREVCSVWTQKHT